ncbi:MAG: bis-aminopropyl spermidine synthase family protein [Pseudonocardiales bacterium]|nr:bis-aminopropyl spermidine synthase family protein [Pseudonocardiales bacterium]
MSQPAEPSVCGAAVGPGADRVTALIAGHAPEAVRLRAVLGRVVAGGRHQIPHLVRGSGLSRQLLLALLRSAGADIGWDGDTVWFAGVQGEYHALIAAEFTASSHDDDAVPAVLVERMRGILARVPPPIRGLDHVPATAETVLRRARYLAREFDLDQTRLLFVGDHDCTSLAFAVLGVAPRSVTVVDIDERLLAFIASQPQAADASITPLFADLRLGLPESARAAHDVAFTDPPYTADGVGLFVARAVEGLAEPSKGRILVAYGYSESTPALGLKVQRALADLELLFETVLPDFNHYDGAQAIGSRADLYRLRPTKRTDRIAMRALARYGKTMYTHGSQSEESCDGSASVTARDTVAQRVVEQFSGGTSLLLVGAGWAGHNTVPIDRFLAAEKSSRQTETTIIDLRPLFGWSLIRAALIATSERTIIIAPRDAYGLHSPAESAQLRAALEPHYQVETIQRSFLGTDSAVVELRGSTTESVAANVWHRPYSRVATTWRESLIAAARRHGTDLTKNQARTLIEQTQLTASVTDHRLIDLPIAILAWLRQAIDETARPYSDNPATGGRSDDLAG